MCASAGKQVSIAPCEEVAMTPDVDMWVLDALNCNLVSYILSRLLFPV